MRSLVAFVAMLFMVAAAPHKAIIDTPDIRDVGIVYTEPNYQGTSLFLLENQQNPSCYPLNIDGYGAPKGVNVSSVKVCMKDCTCTFFTGPTCGAPSLINFAAALNGPGDNADVQTTSGHTFSSYLCRGSSAGGGPHGGFENAPNVTLPAVPHVGAKGVVA